MTLARAGSGDPPSSRAEQLLDRKADLGEVEACDHQVIVLQLHADTAPRARAAANSSWGSSYTKRPIAGTGRRGLRCAMRYASALSSILTRPLHRFKSFNSTVMTSLALPSDNAGSGGDFDGIRAKFGQPQP